MARALRLLDDLRRLRAKVGAALNPRPEPPRAVDPLAWAPLDVLAAKVVFAHLRNRQQMLGPPPTAFGQLDPDQTELLIRAAVVAAHANGRMTEREERLMRAALSTLGLQAGERDFLAGELRRPAPLESLLREVRDGHMASLFYAASLLAIDKQDEVNRAYLAYLAKRLALPETMLTRLHSQHGYAP